MMEQKKAETFECYDGNVVLKNKKGHWEYQPINPLNLLRKARLILTKKEHDKPRYKVIIEYEDNYKSSVNTFLSKMTTDLVRKMKSMI